MTIDVAKFDRLFNPKTAVVIGDKQALGYSWLNSMSTFKGPVYSVQIDEREIPNIEAMGVQNYKSLMDVPGDIDFVIVSVPAGSPPWSSSSVSTRASEALHSSPPASQRPPRRRASPYRTSSPRWLARLTSCWSGPIAWASSSPAVASASPPSSTPARPGPSASSARAAPRACTSACSGARTASRSASW